jgi:O-antigen ligase
MTGWLSALFGFALTVAYWPGISGAATTARWDVAALLGVAVFFLPRVRMTSVHWLGLLLVGWLILTLAWSEGQLDGVDAAEKLVMAGMAFAVGSTMLTLRPLLIGSSIGLSVSSALVIAQFFGWHGIPTTDNQLAGLFGNQDRLGAAAAIVAIGLMSTGPRWLLLPLLPALVLTQSRGAWLAVIVGALVMPMPRVGRFIRWFSVGIAIAFMLHRGMDVGMTERFQIAGDTIGALNVFGHGLGSFWESFPSHAQLFSIASAGTRPDHPHNEWLWLAYEGGLPAFVLGMLFAAAVYRESSGSERPMLAGLFVLSMFAMPFHDPCTLIVGALCAGYSTRNVDWVRVSAQYWGTPVRPGRGELERAGQLEPSAGGGSGVPVRPAVS